MNVELLNNVKQLNILVVGDFMIDKYIEGDVTRISPEAPVPVLRVTSKKSKLGGAGNVVNNLAMLGAKIRVAGCIGADENGNQLMKELGELGVDTRYLEHNEDIQTITKTRLVSKKQQFLRYDEEEVKDVPESFCGLIRNNLEEVFRGIQILVISDYGKGSIRKELSQMLISYAAQNGISSLVDPKGTDYEKYAGATVCTPNMNELCTVLGRKIYTEEDIESYGKELRKELKIDNLMITRSEKGISLINKEGVKKDFPAVEKEVIDVTGAGDTVVSAVAVCLGVGYSVEDSCVIANIAASNVCSKFGAATLTLNELIGDIINSGEFKEVELSVARYIVKGLKEKGKKIVFTNGCFDLLHAGHVASFLQAKSFGDILVVAVNSDSSVKKIKGDKRPIISQKNRVKMLCSLECIDYVVVMEETTPEKILSILQPDIVVKGRDWEGKEMPEKKVIDSYGGVMKFIDLEEGLSTTNIIHKISEVY